ncbi:DoxX family protein [Luteolibacter sp. AS25]|uniref:DoxX family protein n=1 Tax=Luteolibacter sp. AS25 TaxID=3135776 RepID=UPI00398AA8DA
MTQITNSKLAYLGIRIAFGISMIFHGGIRFPKLDSFATGMSGQFSETFLAGFPALSFAYLIPFVEVAVGLSLLIGWKVICWGAFTGCLLMGGIMLGTCVLEKWELLPSQLIHLFLFYTILNNPNTPDAQLKPAS